MITLTVTCRDDAERLAVEQAIAFVCQLHQLAATAPDGQVLAACGQAEVGADRILGIDGYLTAGSRRMACPEWDGFWRNRLPKPGGAPGAACGLAPLSAGRIMS